MLHEFVDQLVELMQGLVPVTAGVGSPRHHASQPEKPVVQTESLGAAACFRQHLERPVDLPEIEERGAEVAVCAGALDRVDRVGDLDALLEVLETAPVADAETADTNVVERMRLELVEAELLGHRERLAPDTDCMLAVAGKHLETRDVGQHVCLRVRARLVLDESFRRSQVLERSSRRPVSQYISHIKVSASAACPESPEASAISTACIRNSGERLCRRC